MTATVKARTARIAHRCHTCRRTSIAPGHRYLRHVMFPGDINTSGRPWTSLQCVACAADRDDSAPMLLAGACASYCHGVTPCARPFRHDGDHECQQCLAESRAALLETVPSRPSRPFRDEPPLRRPIQTVRVPALTA